MSVDPIGALAAGATDGSMRQLANHFAAGDASVADVARLAVELAGSGETVSHAEGRSVDIASTGGPGSLTTLLAPLLVRSLGARVSKVAVPGRPAGGLDVLGSLPGYHPWVGLSDAVRILDACDYLHVGAGDVFCPLDAVLFEWRQSNGFQAVPDLAIASLLAKKLAAGASRVVLDVRVGPFGNFGADREAASRNSRRFIAVAALLGIEALCCIGPAQLAQPFIGRGEAARALATVLQGTATGPLAAHAHDCLRLASLAVGEHPEPDQDLQALLPLARAAHEAMLAAHGADLAEFEGRVQANARTTRQMILAEQDGYVDLDVASVRRALVEHQTRAVRPSSRFPDSCGVEVLVPAGDPVRAGQPIMAVRSDSDRENLVADLAAAVSVAEHPNEAELGLMEIVRG